MCPRRSLIALIRLALQKRPGYIAAVTATIRTGKLIVGEGHAAHIGRARREIVRGNETVINRADKLSFVCRKKTSCSGLQVREEPSANHHWSLLRARSFGLIHGRSGPRSGEHHAADQNLASFHPKIPSHRFVLGAETIALQGWSSARLCRAR
jgi:hypothetical protein